MIGLAQRLPQDDGIVVCRVESSCNARSEEYYILCNTGRSSSQIRKSIGSSGMHASGHARLVGRLQLAKHAKVSQIIKSKYR